MKILFVYRGYGSNQLNSVIDSQYNALIKNDIKVDKFTIMKGGVSGYLKALISLIKYLQNTNHDIIHAHYSYSGFVSRLATSKPVICSLMGSDLLQEKSTIKLITFLFYKYFWSKTIVKSEQMKKNLPNSEVLPNGVDFENFRPADKIYSAKLVGFNLNHHNIIFVAHSPNSKVKNLSLAKKSIELTNNNKIKLHIISNKTFEEMPYYYNAADLLLLTSLSEGSPNVIKEAMACNCPIVSTDVGDIKQLFDNTEGCYITSFNENEIAKKINEALNYVIRYKKTNGRVKIEKLNNKFIIENLIDIYKNNIKSFHEKGLL